jgi:hypothetical protein
MKILALIVALFFAVNSIAVAPYGFRGQNQTAVQYSNVLQFPNSQVTKLAGINSLVETGNKNILLNPDFENNTFNSSWTATTVTPAVETTTVISGKKSVIMTPSAQTFTFVQDSTLYASNFQGSTQLLAMVWVRTNQTGIKVCSRNDGVTSTTNCLTVAPQSPSVWQLIKVPFISSSTSNGISIEASTSITGNVYIDDAFVGAVDLKTDVSTVTAWQSYTPTFTGFGSPSAIEFFWRQVGENIEVKGKFTSGVSTTTEARISLPNNYTSAGVSKIPTIQVAGYAGKNASTVTVIPLIEPSVTYLTFGQQIGTGSGAFTKTNGDSLVVNGSQLGFTATVPVAGLQGVTSIYSASCGANCEDEFSADVSSAGVVSGENVNWISGNASVASSVYTFTWTSGLFTVAPNCFTTPRAAGVGTQFQSMDSTSSTGGVVSSVANSVATNRAYTIICQKQGADFVATRTITGSFAEVPTTRGSNGVDIQSVYFGGGASCSSQCNTVGLCTICNRVGTKITTIEAMNTTGSYRANGVDGTKYNCSGTGVGVQGAPIQHDRVASTSTYAQLQAWAGGTGQAIAYANITCIGIP